MCDPCCDVPVDSGYEQRRGHEWSRSVSQMDKKRRTSGQNAWIRLSKEAGTYGEAASTSRNA